MENKYLYLTLIGMLIAVVSYFIGSIPTARIIARNHGVDITKEGSHNAGGTNVGRVIGKKAGILTMFLDALKCYIPCLIVFLIFTYVDMSSLISNQGLCFIKELLVSITALFVAIGHSFPIYCKFKGGKCVACFAGYMVFISPLCALVGCIFFFSIFAWKRRVSLASITAAPATLLTILIPMFLDLFYDSDKTHFNGGTYFAPNSLIHLTFITTITVFLLVALIIIRHRTNIERLEKGTEPETHFKED